MNKKLSIRELIEKYVTAETKVEQEFYASLLNKIDFFEFIHEHSRRISNGTRKT